MKISCWRRAGVFEEQNMVAMVNLGCQVDWTRHQEADRQAIGYTCKGFS